MTPLERRYRLWLLPYPGGYRREHDQELVGTLLEAAEPDQEWPAAREIFALVTGGLRTRARLAAASPARVRADGLRLGAILYLAVACAFALAVSLRSVASGGPIGIPGRSGLVPLETAVLAIGVVALVRAAYEVGLAAMAGMAVIQAIAAWKDVSHLGGPAALVPSGLLLVAAVVAALAWHPWLRPIRRSWPARTAALALATIGVGTLCVMALDAVALQTTPGFVRAIAVAQPALLGPAAVLLLLALLGLDPRPALAATVFAASYAVGRVQTLGLTNRAGFAAVAVYEQATLVSLAVAIAAALTVTLLSARRRAPI